MGRALRLALFLVVAALPAAAQDRQQTMADIKQQLEVMKVELLTLQRELSTTGAVNAPQSGGSVLDRVNAMQSELMRLTGKIEELENRIDRVVRDGTNRIGTLEYRLTELAGGDLSSIPPIEPLGGEEPGSAVVTAPTPAPSAQGGATAVGEQADFDRAKQAYDAGSYAEAAAQFQTFTQTYTAGPLYSEAHFWRGEALSQQGDTSGAARAYLDSFSGAPSGTMAGPALFKLGQSLGQLGQTQEACVTLSEVGTRFPGSPAANDAAAARQNLGCQ